MLLTTAYFKAICSVVLRLADLIIRIAIDLDAVLRIPQRGFAIGVAGRKLGDNRSGNDQRVVDSTGDLAAHLLAPHRVVHLVLDEHLSRTHQHVRALAVLTQFRLLPCCLTIVFKWLLDLGLGQLSELACRSDLVGVDLEHDGVFVIRRPVVSVVEVNR